MSYGPGPGPGPGQGPGLGGILGGIYPGCGCSSFFIIAAGMLLVFGGLLRSCNM